MQLPADTPHTEMAYALDDVIDDQRETMQGSALSPRLDAVRGDWNECTGVVVRAEMHDIQLQVA